MWELCSYLLSPLLAMHRLEAPVFCVLCCMSPMSYVHAKCPNDILRISYY
jgi:hypothetical protein